MGIRQRMSVHDLLSDIADDRAPEWAVRIVRDRLIEAIDDELPWLVNQILLQDREAVWSHIQGAWEAAQDDLARELHEEGIADAAMRMEALGARGGCL